MATPTIEVTSPDSSAKKYKRIKREEDDRITINSLGIDVQRRLKDGKIVNRWKEEFREEGDRAMWHFFIDFEKEKLQKTSWFTVMNNLLNNQAKYHRVLLQTAKKNNVDFDVDDFYEKRRLEQESLELQVQKNDEQGTRGESTNEGNDNSAQQLIKEQI